MIKGHGKPNIERIKVFNTFGYDDDGVKCGYFDEGYILNDDDVKELEVYCDSIEKENKLLNKTIQRSRSHIEDLIEILKSHKIECCEICQDYMLESKNCKYDTEYGCTNWKLRGDK